MANVIVWADIPVRDLDRATAFYARVLALDLSVMDAGGFRLTVFPSEGSEVAGCLFESDRVGVQGPLIYFNVEGRLPEAAAEAANGGSVVEPPHKIGPHGFRAVIADSEGNRVALHSMKGEGIE